MDKVTGSPAGIQSGAGCLAADAPDSIQYVGFHRRQLFLFFFIFFLFLKDNLDILYFNHYS